MLPLPLRLTLPHSLPRTLHLTLLESARSMHALPALRRLLLGVTVMAAPVTAALIANSVDVASLATREVPRFLQPLVSRPTVRAPRTETVTELALGTAPAPPSIAAPTAAPRAMVLQPDVGAPVQDSARTTAVATVDDAPPLFAFSDIEVDTAAAADPASGGPEYPPTLLAKGVEGAVLASFIVDATGRVEERSFLAIESTDPAFTRAVRDALARMKFRPARRGADAVPQLVEQRFSFRVRRA